MQTYFVAIVKTCMTVINTKFIRVVFSEKGKAGMRLEDRVYRVASCIRFYLKQANMAKR